MSETYLALGSNLGDRKQYLVNAVNYLKSIGVLLLNAGLYETGAYGFTEQPAFLNSALLLDTHLNPLDLLNQLKNIENMTGRKQRHRWGPREIDLDIIFYENQVIQTRELTIPHPDFQNRRFVLQPLMDIAPNFISPAQNKTVSQLFKDCRDSTRVQRIAKEWYVHGT